jgi:hypothetical protein
MLEIDNSDEAATDKDCLYGVGECMCLECPGDIGRRVEQHRGALMRCVGQAIHSPI